MDTITHGIAGALIAKALFRGEDLFAWPGKPAASPTARPQAEQRRFMNRGRVVSWALMLGAIFPDSDVLRDALSHDKLLIVTWHRSLTHSLLLLPLWALLLGALSWGIAKWLNWEAPSMAALIGIYAVGILSHILLDLVTSFGTMIWSPLEWSRPAWDLIFIVDFTLSGLLVVPQFLAWAYSEPEKMKRRTLGLWLVFMPAPLLIARIGANVGAPISGATVLAALAVLAAVIFLPLVRNAGLRVPYAAWSRAGLAATLVYVALAFFAHRVALARIERFARADQLEVQSIGALPLPPSLWRWDGLVRAPRGVYELRMDLSERPVKAGELLALEHRYYPDAPSNAFIEAAKRLPEVQKMFWFARFPVTRFRKEGANAVVEIFDVRFRREGSRQPRGFSATPRQAPPASW